MAAVMSNESDPTVHRHESLRERAFQFSLAVVRACPKQMDDASRVIWKQLVRSSSSVAGNLAENSSASSRGDFLNRMKLILRESKESAVWLRLIAEAPLANARAAATMRDEARQLVSIFGAIVRNTENNEQDEGAEE